MWICYCNTHTYTVHVETDTRTKATHSTPFFQDPECRVWACNCPCRQISLTRQWFPEYQIESMELIFSPLRFAASAVVRWCFSWSSFAGSFSNNGWSDSPESVPNLAMSAFCFSIRLKSSWKDWWNPSFNMSRHRLCSYVLRYLLNQDDTKEKH